MPERSDHDLLVTIDERLRNLMKQHEEFVNTHTVSHAILQRDLDALKQWKWSWAGALALVMVLLNIGLRMLLR